MSRGAVPVRFLLTWAALLTLAAATVAVAYWPLGVGNTVAALAIAAGKAGLVLVLFMRIGRHAALAKVFAGVGVLWLIFLFLLSGADYASRTWNPF